MLVVPGLSWVVSRGIQFPPREQLLTAVVRGADVAVEAAVVVV
jgi:hypothetical protein